MGVKDDDGADGAMTLRSFAELAQARSRFGAGVGKAGAPLSRPSTGRVLEPVVGRPRGEALGSAGELNPQVSPMISNQSVGFAPGDVVACRFPIAEQPDRPGEKVRPCLVLAVHERRDGKIFAEVAYGTDAKRTSNSGFDFTLEDQAEYRRAGLNKATRFVLARSAMIPVSEEYLDYNHAGSATIGCLPPKSRQRMRELHTARTASRRPKGLKVVHRPRRKIVRVAAPRKTDL